VLDRLWGNSEVFHFVQVGRLQISNGSLGSVNLRLDSRKLLLNLLLSILNSNFVLGAAGLKLIYLSLPLSSLLHGMLNLLHRSVCFLLLMAEFDLLFSSILAQSVDCLFGFLKFLKTSYQMGALTSTGSYDLREDELELLNEVHKPLRAGGEVRRGGVVEEYCTAYNWLNDLGEVVRNFDQLVPSNDAHALFAPAVTPQNSTLREKSGILGAVGSEFRVLVVQTQHDGQVLLDAADVELEQSTAFILLCHLVFQAAEDWLKFFRGVKAGDFSSRN